MSLNTFLILIGVILILVDIFFASDLPTFIALLLFTYVFFRILPFHLLYRIILTILFFAILLIVYIAAWRKVVSIVVDKWFAKDKYRAGASGFPGKTGIIKVVDDKKYAQIDGNLYALFEDYPLNNGDGFLVKELKDGKIIIEQ